MSEMRCESASAQSGVRKPIARTARAELARLLEALAVDQRDVGADRGVLGDVAVEAVG